MVQIPSYQAREFQAQNTPVYTPRGLTDSLNALLNTGHKILDKRAADEGLQEGIKEQQGKTSLELENGWTIRDEARDKGRQMAFEVVKRREMEAATQQLKDEYKFDPATFQKKHSEFRTKFMQGIPTELQPAYAMMAEDAGLKTQTQIQANRDAYDRQVNGQTIIDELTTLENEIFALGQDDPDSDEVLEKLATFTTTLQTASSADAAGGPVITPDQAGAYRRSIQQTIRRAEVLNGYEQSTDKAAYIKEVETGNYDGDAMSEASQNHVVSEMNRRLRRDKAEMDSELRLLDKRADNAIKAFKDGDIPAGYENLLKDIDNSPHPDASILGAKLEVYENIQSTMSDFRERSLPEQQAQIAQISKIIQERGWTEERDVLRTAMEQTHVKLIIATKNGDLLSYAEEAKAIDPNPFDVDSPDTWQARNKAAEAATVMMGSKVQPLKPEEVEALVDEYSSSNAQRQEDIEDKLFQFTGGGDALHSVLTQMWPKNPSAAVSFGLRHTPDMSRTKQAKTAARYIKEGAAIIAQNPKVITETSKVQAEIQDQIAPLFTSEDGNIMIDFDGSARAGLADAVFNAYVSLMVKGGRTGENQSTATIKEAVGMVVGSPKNDFPSFNGGKFVPFRYGMANRQSTGIIDALRDSDFEKAGTGKMPVVINGTLQEPVSIEKIKDDGRFVSIRPGQYQIWIPRPKTLGGYRPLQDPNTGRAYIFDFEKIASTAIPAATLRD